MKTLITGGAGFIGSHVAEAFLAAGHDVAVVDNLRTGSSQHVPPGARLYVTHVGSPEFSDILEKERDRALKKVKGAEVTRFKGLGEISPKEFGRFIGDEMKLVKTTIEKRSAVPKTLEFYMGKNTPERREYIMRKMV